MRTVVQKYGGTSLRNSSRLKRVAREIIKRQREGWAVAVVVSAQGDTTDRLIERAMEVSTSPSGRELDMLLSTGEQVSASLLSMTLEEMGAEAVSYTGWQAGIETTGEYNNARILGVAGEDLMRNLSEGRIAVVTGFQGRDEEGNITTLGRGGSDTTAVALAVAAGAEYVEIYTDVDGIYSGDPRIVEGAEKLSSITYEEMTEMAGKGARVLHARSVEMAARYGMPIHLRSSYTWEDGTWIGGGNDMEKAFVRGITHLKGLGKVSVRGLHDISRVERVLHTAEGEMAEIQIINQGIASDGSYEVDLLMGREEALNTGRQLRISLERDEAVEVRLDLGMVSATGSGVRSGRLHGRVIRLINSLHLPTRMMASSEISLSYVVEEGDVERLKREIHRELIEKSV